MSSVPRIAVLIAYFIVGTCCIILVPTIFRSARHAVLFYVHAVSVRPTLPTGVTNVFPIDPLWRPICWSLWFLWYIEGINPHGRLLEMMGQVGNGCGEVRNGLARGHHRVPV